jgi:hypothetical protein
MYLVHCTSKDHDGMRVVNSDLFYGERGRMGRVRKGPRGGFGGKKLV